MVLVARPAATRRLAAAQPLRRRRSRESLDPTHPPTHRASPPPLSGTLSTSARALLSRDCWRPGARDAARALLAEPRRARALPGSLSLWHKRLANTADPITLPPTQALPRRACPGPRRRAARKERAEARTSCGWRLWEMRTCCARGLGLRSAALRSGCGSAAAAAGSAQGAAARRTARPPCVQVLSSRHRVAASVEKRSCQDLAHETGLSREGAPSGAPASRGRGGRCSGQPPRALGTRRRVPAAARGARYSAAGAAAQPPLPLRLGAPEALAHKLWPAPVFSPTGLASQRRGAAHWAQAILNDWPRARAGLLLRRCLAAARAHLQRRPESRVRGAGERKRSSARTKGAQCAARRGAPLAAPAQAG